MKRVELRLPGPMELPPQIFKYLEDGEWLINHRGEEFKELLEQVTSRLKKVFQTENDILILAGSGTLGMEASVISLCGINESNLLTPLFLSNGYFGDTFIQIAEGFRIVHEKAKFSRDEAISIDELEKEISKFGRGYYGALYFVHNESSNGITNNAIEIARVAREHNQDIVIVMDAISSMGGINIPVDEWGIDIAITASQKALMAPPGVVLVSVSNRAWDRIDKVKYSGFYASLKRYREYSKKGQTPSTPCLPVVGALNMSAGLILRKGIEKISARHFCIADYIKKELRKMGFEIFGDEKSTSNTITAAFLPRDLRSSFTSKEFVEFLKKKEKLEISAGIHGNNDYIRIGHMGYITESGARRIIRKIKRIVVELRQKSA